jgi:hypothetical protein
MPHTTSTAFDYAIVTVQRSRKPIRTKKLVRNRKSRKKRQIPKQHIQLSFWASIARPSFKITNFTPIIISPHARLLTALWIGTIVLMSTVRIMVLARHGGKELCFGGVHPVSVARLGY